MATERLIPTRDADLYKGDKYLIIACEEGHPGYWILLESEPKTQQPQKPALSLIKQHETIWF